MKFFNNEVYIITRREEEYPGFDDYPDIQEETFLGAGVFETLYLARAWLKNYVSKEIERRKKYGHEVRLLDGKIARQTGEKHFLGWQQEKTETKFFIEPVRFHEEKEAPF